ncbi:MAG: carbon monoxide dehydrogenase, partial [Pseudomonadota bacterium]
EHALTTNFSPDALANLTPPNPNTMIADLHGSQEYRAHLCKVMTTRAVKAMG